VKTQPTGWVFCFKAVRSAVGLVPPLAAPGPLFSPVNLHGSRPALAISIGQRLWQNFNFKKNATGVVANFRTRKICHTSGKPVQVQSAASLNSGPSPAGPGDPGEADWRSETRPSDCREKLCENPK
jgi:hypothetical protein